MLPSLALASPMAKRITPFSLYGIPFRSTVIEWAGSRAIGYSLFIRSIQ